MRIPCPLCGERSASEFTYRGDTNLTRPTSLDEKEDHNWYSYVYLRDNPRGEIEEHWHHTSGCRSWIVVKRNTQTHVVSGSILAKDYQPPSAPLKASKTENKK